MRWLVLAFTLLLPACDVFSSDKFEVYGEMYQPTRQPFTGFHAFWLNEDEILLLNFDCQAELYYPKTKRFEYLSEICEARFFENAFQLSDKRIVVVDGATMFGRVKEGVFDKSETTVEEFVPETKRFRKLGKLLLPRGKASVVVLPDDNLLVYGGTEIEGKYIRHSVTLAETKKVELFDTKKGTSRFVGELSTHCIGESPKAVLMKNGKVVVMGGCGRGEKKDYLQIYDPVTQKFTLGPKFVKKADIKRVFSLSKTQTLIFDYEGAKLYDLEGGKVIKSAQYPKNTGQGSILKVNDRYVYIMGSSWPFLGQDIWQHTSNRTIVFDIDKHRFMKGPSLEIARLGGVPVLWNDTILLFAGSGNNGSLDTVESYTLER